MTAAASLLRQGFDFYGIRNEKLIAAVEKTADDVRRDPEKRAVYEKFREAAFSKKFSVRKELSAFKPYFEGDRQIPYFTQYFLLSSAAIHRENLERFGFAENGPDGVYHREKIRNICEKAFESGLLNVNRNLFHWAILYCEGLMLRSSALVFECRSENEVAVHIPDGADLSPDSVQKSLSRAIPVLKSHFGEDLNAFICSSWLLCPQVTALLNDKSNIRRFAELFTVAEGGDCLHSLYNKLFRVDRSTPIADLPEDTSLQKSVKSALLTGKSFKTGEGFLPFDAVLTP